MVLQTYQCPSNIGLIRYVKLATRGSYAAPEDYVCDPRHYEVMINPIHI